MTGVTYFHSFHCYILNEIKKFRDNKHITANTCRIQIYNLIMCGCFCIVFTHFMQKEKRMSDYTNLFSPNECKSNDEIKLKFLQ